MELLRSINEEMKAAEEMERLEEAGLIKKAMGKVAGAVGMKGTAANLQAQGEADQQIKQLKIAFNQFAGQMGKKMNAATVDDLASFFKSKNLPVAGELGKRGTPLGQVGKEAINKAFATAVQGGAKRQMRQAAPGTAAQPQQSQPQQQAQAAQPQQGGKLGNIAKALAGLTPSAQNSLIAALQS